MVRALGQRLRALTGWRRWLVAFLAGASSVLALAPFFLWGIMLFTLPVLVLLFDGAAAQARTVAHAVRSFAAIAWWWGFGYFLLGLHWIASAFIADGNFLWLLPFAVTLMPAGLALFYAAAGALAACYWPGDWRRIVVLAVVLTAAEFLRGHLFTGFPWNLLGHTLSASDGLLQWAAVFGAYGLTFLAVLLFAAPAAGGLFVGRFPTVREAAYPYAMLALLLLLWGGGYVRLLQASSSALDDKVVLRLVQPAIPQVEKWQPENKGRIFRDYLALTGSRTRARPDGLKGVTHVIWPEAALPFLLLQAPYALREIRDLLPDGVALLTGGNRAEARMAPAPGGAGLPFDISRFRRPAIYNSVLVFDDQMRLQGRYDKVHLVPFGEYLPFQSLLEAIGLRQLTRLRGGFEAGRKRGLLRVGGAPAFVPLICYEVIFSGHVVPPGPRPGWLLNVTNDAWFGHLSGPYQHFHQARLRAVEEGLPLVRAANTGVSAVIDPYGRVLAQLPLGKKAVLDATLPKPLPPTLYARYGEGVLLLLFGLGLLVLFIGRGRGAPAVRGSCGRVIER